MMMLIKKWILKYKNETLLSFFFTRNYIQIIQVYAMLLYLSTSVCILLPHFTAHVINKHFKKQH